MMVFYPPQKTNNIQNIDNKESCFILTEFMYKCYNELDTIKTGNKTVDGMCSMYNIVGISDRKTNSVIHEKTFKKVLYNQCIKSTNN